MLEEGYHPLAMFPSLSLSLDSSHRDFTINSLFYNINTNTVEDFTGKGLEDLKNRKNPNTPFLSLFISLIFLHPFPFPF